MRRRLAGALAGTALAMLAIGSVAGATIHPSENPANDSQLIGKPIEGFRYDYAKRCHDRMPPGMKLLQAWLERNVRGETWGIYRCEKLGGGHYSLHSEDRAIDWHLDSAVPKDRHAAMELIHTLLAPDRDGNYAALARRMGVQGLIYNCRDWWSGMHGMGPYSYCYKPNGQLRNHLDYTQAHRDHVHIELDWPGARAKTSFWRSPLARR